MSASYHLAQLNIARAVAPLDAPVMADFMARLADVNALADASPGFVWRLQTEAGNATDLRPYADDRFLINLSVWEALEPLKAYVYKTVHGQVLARRYEWFEKPSQPSLVLWWIPAGQIPPVAEAQTRLEHLRAHGETPHAFTFKRPYPPPSSP
jgi:hypothetical protein